MRFDSSVEQLKEMAMTLDELLEQLYDDCNMEPSETVEQAGRNVAHLMD